MRIKLDENLPESLANSLEAIGHSVDTVRAEGLVGRPDADVWQARLVHVFRSLEVATWAGCFVLVTDLKVRVHRSKS